jgi:cation diffusion facilitator CzcD-associated flavoprotein CzcO
MSQTSSTLDSTQHQGVEHFDVLIVGAGISGIGAGYHLQDQYPEKSFVILEKFESFGGTWLTHKYPGIRSDSDLYTFGYRFKPWIGPPIATADKILAYMGEVIEENDLDRHIRYHHAITSAGVVECRQPLDAPRHANRSGVRRCDAGDVHDQLPVDVSGLLPPRTGLHARLARHGRLRGRDRAPQTWPSDIDLSGKQVLVIGSGATAATLVPAIADECGHVTMLQRSPTYFFSRPNVNEVADMLRDLDVPEEWTHEIVRRKALKDGDEIARMSFEYPEMVRDELIGLVRAELPEGYDVETHFTPRYLPWRQRIAMVPDGDLFKGISSGKASVVTDEIETFNATGILTKSGRQLDADVIITATGFDLSVLGDIQFTVDGTPVNYADTVTYRGMMFTGVPNMVWVFGYFRASWTLRADLIGDWVCRLLHHMDDLGVRKVTPQLRPEDADMQLGSWIDPENFNPGYLMRSQHLMPKRGDKPEWQHTQDYMAEKDTLPVADLRPLIYE